MGGYEVAIEAVKKSSACARRAADGLRGVDLAGTLTGAGQGMPGGTVVEAARLLADLWGRELPAWASDMDEYSAQLATAAHLYETDDAAAARDLRLTSTGRAQAS